MGLYNNRSDDDHIICSRHIKLVKNQEYILIEHDLNGTQLEVSEDLLWFLDLFKTSENSRKLLKAKGLLHLSNLVLALKKDRFLVPIDIRESIEWFKQQIDFEALNKVSSKHYIIYHNKNKQILTQYLVQELETIYENLIVRGLPELKSQIIVYICNGRDEFNTFFGSTIAPESLYTFVIARSIVILDSSRINLSKTLSQGKMIELTHEIAHIFLGEMSIQLPMWFEEGFCEWSSKSITSRHTTFIRKSGIENFQNVDTIISRSTEYTNISKKKLGILYLQSHCFFDYLAKSFGINNILKFIKSVSLSNYFFEQFSSVFKASFEDTVFRWMRSIGI